MSIDKKNTPSRRLLLWALLCFIISFLFLDKIQISSWSYFVSCGLYPWAVLMLCALWIYFRREEQIEIMRQESEKPPGLSFILLGILIVIVSISMPKDVGPAGIVFEMLLAYLGFFVIFFGEAASMPGILAVIFGFSVGFPVVVARYLEEQYSSVTVAMVTGILKTSGFQFVSHGRMIDYVSAHGREISLLVDSACAGSGSMTIFVAIFALMMLDVTLPRKGALYMFAFGIVGTTLQNVLRIIFIVFAGYYYDVWGVSMTHAYAGYVLFPAWFILFAYVYFTYAKKLSKNA